MECSQDIWLVDPYQVNEVPIERACSGSKWKEYFLCLKDKEVMDELRLEEVRNQAKEVGSNRDLGNTNSQILSQPLLQMRRFAMDSMGKTQTKRIKDDEAREMPIMYLSSSSS